MKNKKSIKKLCMFGLAVGSLLSSAASFQIHGKRELSASITNTLDSNVATATFEVTLKFVNDAGKMLSVVNNDEWVDFFKANFEIFQYLNPTSNEDWTPSDQTNKTSVDPEEIKEINAIKNTESNSVKFKITVNYPFALSFDSSQALQVTPYYYMIQPKSTIFPGYTLSNADSTGIVYIKLVKINQ